MAQGKCADPVKENERRLKIAAAKWKGDDAGYHAIHIWIRKVFPKPERCPSCNLKKPLQAHNISGTYIRDISDWRWLCCRCHMIEDGRLEIHRERMTTINRERKNGVEKNGRY